MHTQCWWIEAIAERMDFISKKYCSNWNPLNFAWKNFIWILDIHYYISVEWFALITSFLFFKLREREKNREEKNWDDCFLKIIKQSLLGIRHACGIKCNSFSVIIEWTRRLRISFLIFLSFTINLCNGWTHPNACLHASIPKDYFSLFLFHLILNVLSRRLNVF